MEVDVKFEGCEFEEVDVKFKGFEFDTKVEGALDKVELGLAGNLQED